jgi:hypothetical protein
MSNPFPRQSPRPKQGDDRERAPRDPADGPRELELSGQYRLIVQQTEGGSSVRLVAPDASAPLLIEITPSGVRVQLAAPSVAIETQGEFSLSAEHLTLRGRSGLTLESGGDLDVVAARELRSRAQAQIVRAEQGEVDIKATDDVKLSGERVMVNCDEAIDYFRRPPR